MDFDVAVGRIAGRQHGSFSRRQAVAVGATPVAVRVRVESGRWRVIHRGVYAIAGAPDTWHQRLMAASLATGGLVSYSAAARLWGLEIRATGIHLLIPRGRVRRHDGISVHTTTDLIDADRATVDGIPVTSVARTICDLARALPFTKLDDLVGDALHQGLVRLPRLAWRAGDRPSASLRAVLEAPIRGPAPKSHPENRFA